MSKLRAEISALDRIKAALREAPAGPPEGMKRQEARLQADLRDPAKVEERGGVLRWRATGGVVPTFVYKDAGLACPAAQRTAYEKQERAFIAEYRRVQGKRKPSSEEMHEMRAAFGPGKTLVNVLTGRRTRT